MLKTDKLKLSELAELMGVTVGELEKRLKSEDTISVDLKDKEKKERENGKIVVV